MAGLYLLFALLFLGAGGYYFYKAYEITQQKKQEKLNDDERKNKQ